MNGVRIGAMRHVERKQEYNYDSIPNLGINSTSLLVWCVLGSYSLYQQILVIPITKPKGGQQHMTIIRKPIEPEQELPSIDDLDEAFGIGEDGDMLQEYYRDVPIRQSDDWNLT